MGQLKGQLAVITGGTSGIGRAIAERFLSEGARLIVTGTNSERAEAARVEWGERVQVLGRIVLVSSIAAHNGGRGHSVYNATKSAVRSLARTLTSEPRERGIRANAISPGPTATEGFARFTGGSATVEQAVAEVVPVGRIGRPDEVAAAVLFLSSHESSFVAGAELVVDGGMSQV